MSIPLELVNNSIVSSRSKLNDCTLGKSLKEQSNIFATLIVMIYKDNIKKNILVHRKQNIIVVTCREIH